MEENVIKAEVIAIALVALEYGYMVRIRAPVELPPKIYKISCQEVLVRSYSKISTLEIIYELLRDKILHNYNILIEDSPIMDMFADPMKYKRASSVDLTVLQPEEIRPSY